MAEPARWLKEATTIAAEEAREALRWWWRALRIVWPWWWRVTAILIAADLVWRITK